MKTKEELKMEKLEKRSGELMEKLTNKRKRDAIRYFECSFDELDGLDQIVLIASIADTSKTLEELDNMPMAELEKVILGE